MPRRSWQRSRFDEPEAEPLGPLANLVDIMLVFACGLIAALAAQPNGVQSAFENLSQQEVQKGRELPEVPKGVGGAGSGYEPMGQVYRDPQTGKLILIGGEHESTQ